MARTKKDPIAINTPAPAAADINQGVETQSAYDRVVAAMRELGMKLPSWKRQLLGLIGALITGYGVGYIAGTLIEMVLMATSASFFGYLFSAIILVGAIYAGIKCGQKVGMYIVSGDIDADIITAKNKVLGWFGRNEVLA